MLGKAWSTGALMMVQVADTLPKAFHPRAKLEGAQSSLHSSFEKLQGRLAIACKAMHRKTIHPSIHAHASVI